jgi:DNA repair protein RadA/Sms
MAKRTFICNNCGHTEPKWLGKCPQCGSWNSLEESSIENKKGSRGSVKPIQSAHIRNIQDIVEDELSRITTGSTELDRVLGGGIVPGSSVLVGGEPGIGKSTLMLQTANALADQKVLYISAEESAAQIKRRFTRLELKSTSLELLCTNHMEEVEKALQKNKPGCVILDSIQTISNQEIGAVPGTVNQIKYISHELIQWARENNGAVFIIAHVTKDGNIAGPKVLEHMVDTVLYFEEGSHDLRIIRGKKNRFGSVDELGLFTMTSKGCRQVKDPASRFLIQRENVIPAGTATAAVIEGTRPLLIEIQALTIPAKGSFNRIYSDKIEASRIARVAAILEKHVGMSFNDQDLYINIAGGIRVQEVGIDLALALALFSARSGIALPEKSCSAGELSLAGEVLQVNGLLNRCKTAAEYGMKRFYGAKEKKKIQAVEQYIGSYRLKDLISAINS